MLPRIKCCVAASLARMKSQASGVQFLKNVKCSSDPKHGKKRQWLPRCLVNLSPYLEFFQKLATGPAWGQKERHKYLRLLCTFLEIFSTVHLNSVPRHEAAPNAVNSGSRLVHLPRPWFVSRLWLLCYSLHRFVRGWRGREPSHLDLPAVAWHRLQWSVVLLLGVIATPTAKLNLKDRILPEMACPFFTFHDLCALWKKSRLQGQLVRMSSSQFWKTLQSKLLFKSPVWANVSG